LVLEFSLNSEDHCDGYYGYCGGCDRCSLMQAEHSGYQVFYSGDPEYEHFQLEACGTVSELESVNWQKEGF